ELKSHLDRGEIHVRAFRPGVAETPAGDGGWEEIRVPVASGHGGGDQGLMRDFVRRLRLRRQGLRPGEPLTSLRETVESHLMALAAERSCLEGRVVSVAALRAGSLRRCVDTLALIPRPPVRSRRSGACGSRAA